MTLEEALARITELEAGQDSDVVLKILCNVAIMAEERQLWRERAVSAESRIAELEAALLPFARAARWSDIVDEDCRRAAAALKGGAT